MASITDDEFSQLLRGIKRSFVHLELRDSYGTAVELPHMAKWASGEPDDLAWLQSWCGTLRTHIASGKSLRRARVVSEPLSDYQRWSYSIADPMVDAGEDIRWVPRRLLLSTAVTGNDFYLLDGELVIFLLYAGDGLAVNKVISRDPADVSFCSSVFESVWQHAIRHRDFIST
jgi:hypothetical protein